MAMTGISWAGVFLRVGFALALVLLTFNLSGHSFYHRLTAPPHGVTAIKAFDGALLLVGWVVCLRTAFVALGWLGLVLGAALFGTLVWLLADLKWIDLTGATAFTWVVLIAVGVLLGIGLSWSLIRARATGQVEVQ
jgi:hypothetical protein